MNRNTIFAASAVVLVVAALAGVAANRTRLTDYLTNRSSVAADGAGDAHAHEHSGGDDASHDHSAGTSNQHGQTPLEGHGHAHGGDRTAQITVWGDRFELFIEHALVVAEAPTTFITHISDMHTGEPRRQGPITFLLQHNLHDPIQHRVDRPSRNGIYTPELVFPEPGQWEIVLVIPHAGHDHTVQLPAIRVYSSTAEVAEAEMEAEPDGIAFLKEQQWQANMKVTRARAMESAHGDVVTIPETALIEQAQAWVVYVQLAGETFQRRQVTPCCRIDGVAEITSGLRAGEYVVTSGIFSVAAAEEAGAVDQHAHDDDHTHAGHSPGHAEQSHDHQTEPETHDHTHPVEISVSEDAGHNHGHDAVHLTQQQAWQFGLKVETVGPGAIAVMTKIPGEITFNADRVAHIVPQIPGVAREVPVRVGDQVQTGQPLAWLESSALGKAKIEYMAKLAEISCCAIELTRAEEIYHNTMKLLEMLKSSPALDALRQADLGPMGNNRSQLISAYAEYSLAKAAYEREKQLLEKKITSEEDFLKAETAFRKADAQYQSVRDSVAFSVQQELREAQRAQQVREIELKGAERNLYVLGLTQANVEKLEPLALGQTQQSSPSGSAACNDPNCPTCVQRAAEGMPDVDVEMENRKIAWHPLRAPFDGVVVEKHLSLGEAVKNDSEVFVVADLSTVWVELQVHRKDLPFVAKGREVTIDPGFGGERTEGHIEYVAPVVDPATRTALVRVVLDNESGQLRPGLFVTGIIDGRSTPAKTVVEKTAVQYVDDQPCVFVWDGHAYTQRPVQLGRADEEHVEIVSGLQPGERVVTQGSFYVKAESEKGAAGGGHGHAH